MIVQESYFKSIVEILVCTLIINFNQYLDINLECFSIKLTMFHFEKSQTLKNAYMKEQGKKIFAHGAARCLKDSS